MKELKRERKFLLKKIRPEFIVSIDFSSKFLISSLTLGDPPSEPHTNADFTILLNFWQNWGGLKML